MMREASLKFAKLCVDSKELLLEDADSSLNGRWNRRDPGPRRSREVFDQTVGVVNKDDNSVQDDHVDHHRASQPATAS